MWVPVVRLTTIREQNFDETHYRRNYPGSNTSRGEVNEHGPAERLTAPGSRVGFAERDAS